MSDLVEQRLRQITFNVEPFDSPGAADYYANLTGVGCTPSEIVLVFAQALPGRQGTEEVMSVAPKVRVSLTPSAASKLLEQLSEIIGLHRTALQATE